MRTAWLLLGLLLVPAAQATLTFGTAQVTGVPVTVNSGSAAVTIPATYACDPGEVRLQGTSLRLDPLATPRGTVLSGALEYAIPDTACRGPASETWHESLHFTITATQDAVGEKPLLATVRGSVAAAGTGFGNAHAEQAEAAIPFAVKLDPLVAATVASTIAQAPPGGSVRYNLTFTNLGNANTNLEFSVSGDAPAGWLPVAITPLVLGPSKQVGGSDDTRTVAFEVRLPEKAVGQHEFHVKVVPASTIFPDQKGKEITINVLARAAPLAKAAPAAGPLVLLAIAGCALLARRLQQPQQ